MGKRRGKYALIWQAARLEAARTALINYLSNAANRPAPTGAVENRPPRIELAIEPFNIDLANDQFIGESASVPAWTAHQSHMGGRVETLAAAAGSNTRLALQGFCGARAVFIFDKAATGTRETSRRTGLSYISYGAKSLSVPFGRSTETETELEAITAIRTAYGSSATTGFSWRREAA